MLFCAAVWHQVAADKPVSGRSSRESAEASLTESLKKLPEACAPVRWVELSGGTVNDVGDGGPHTCTLGTRSNMVSDVKHAKESKCGRMRVHGSMNTLFIPGAVVTCVLFCLQSFHAPSTILLLCLLEMWDLTPWQFHVSISCPF